MKALIFLFGLIIFSGCVTQEELYKAELDFCNGLSATPFAEEAGYIEADSVGNIFRCGKCWDNTKECWDDPLDNALYVVCDYPWGTEQITLIGCGGDSCRWQCSEPQLSYGGTQEKARYSKEYWRETWGIDNPYDLQGVVE